jgi:hypothetical protein
MGNGVAQALLYGPSGRLINRDENQISDKAHATATIDSRMQDYTEDVHFDIGELVELRFRSGNGDPQRKGAEWQLGFIAADQSYSDSLRVSMDVPPKRFRPRTMSKFQIAEYQRFPEIDDKSYENTRFPKCLEIGAMIVATMRSSNPFRVVKHAGYVRSVSVYNVQMCMDHPSNRHVFSLRNIKKLTYYNIENYRIIGHRPLF